ncbi:SulP family inorganic anion transporter [Persicirhabdus sediminis]|uniref:SulP family inorganic anion transporter n=1 Tax=Persicirhabdus sediminis TaxID=454144 RepID=A0A8J7SL71_9BACT|nr:SulP family inorganic anion transporter [Persicirhabdus sediminis]MBK1792191.1 SulP family inorganic anion transporter [Persicirhabdus sediminis]
MFKFQKKRGNLKDDVLSGLTVSLVLVPEAIAFSFIAGVNPIIGLWSAVFVGFITAAFGGRPGMICGATGAIAVVAAKAFQEGGATGIEGMDYKYLFFALILAGVIQTVVGLLKLGRYIRLVPHPVMMGFVNGLAVLIAMGQFKFFKTFTGDFDAEGNRIFDWLAGSQMAWMVGLVLGTMAIVVFLPKLTKAVPPSLVAIVSVGLATYFGLFDGRTVADVLEAESGSAAINTSFPEIANLTGLPLGQLDFWIIILPISLTIAMVGLIESLLTLQLIDEITESRGKSNRECLAQGAANILSGSFGGMGGCATIGQSLLNMKSGGRGRTSGIVGALSLAIFILFASPLIMNIPIAALVGVMFMIVIATFEWSTFKTIGKAPNSDIFVILVVTFVTIFSHNLALAVVVGIIVSALTFAVQSSKHVIVEVVKKSADEKIYAVEGMIYFASVSDFVDHFQARSDTPNIVIDFEKARICDHSGIEAIHALSERYRKAGKNLRLRHLSTDCRKIIERAGTLVDIEVLPDDPDYTVARLKESPLENV